MSGTSYSANCPKCNSKDSMMCSSDYKPHDCVCGECLECGFSYWTIDGYMELDEVNEVRQDLDLDPLKELKKRG